MHIVKGNISDSNKSKCRGWVAGHMQTDIAQTGDLEIKLWHYDGPIDYPKKQFSGTEFIVIYGGIIVLELEKNNEKRIVELRSSEGDYIVLEPGIVKRVEVKKAPAFGVTVRWPSSPEICRIL